MVKTKASTKSRPPAGKMVKKAKSKPPVEGSKHAFDEGYEAGWKAGLAKGYLDGFESIYVSEN